MPFADEKALALHLQGLEEDLLRPETRTSPDRVADLLSPAFREFGSSGRAYTRTEIMDLLRSESPVTRSLSEFHLELVSPGVALVTYYSHHHRSDSGASTALRSSLWCLEADGRWRLRFHQGTAKR